MRLLVASQQHLQVLLLLVEGIGTIDQIPMADVNLLVVLEDIFVLEVWQVELVDVLEVGADEEGFVVVGEAEGEGLLVLEL